MLYFRALIQGLDDIPAIDPAVRAAIESEAHESGWPVLHQQLAQVDPEIAQKLHPNHSQRICRALEVYRGTGVPLSEWQKDGGDAIADQFECVALCPEPRAVLHQRIALRLDEMFEKGLIDEVRALWERGDCHTDLPAIRAVGYRQVWSLLNGEIDGATCREQILAATRQLAKRQLTWLRSWPDLTWMITDAEGALVRSLESDEKGLSSTENTRLKGYEARWTQRIEAFFRNF
jgi:tRNA dimethylallyltransferase